MNINDFNKLKPFFDTFQGESDRACGILAGVLLDSLLETLLKTVMLESTPKDIFRGSGALATFSGKTDMAYYLGYISKDEYEELKVIRKIRNDFAHEINHTLSFSTPTIADKTRNLKFSKTLIDARDFTGRNLEEEIVNAIYNIPRKDFEISVSVTCAVLGLRIGKIQQPTSPEGFTDMMRSARALQKQTSTKPNTDPVV